MYRLAKSGLPNRQTWPVSTSLENNFEKYPKNEPEKRAKSHLTQTKEEVAEIALPEIVRFVPPSPQVFDPKNKRTAAESAPVRHRSRRLLSCSATYRLRNRWPSAAQLTPEQEADVSLTPIRSFRDPRFTVYHGVSPLSIALVVISFGHFCNYLARRSAWG
jgi:hypothetical protein